jgi:F0F1-type ATP synthase membrane subunit b/b'
VDSVALPITLAVVTGVLAWFGQSALARRTKSGSPRTAEAETLFSEMRALKDDYKQQLQAAQAELKTAKQRITELERRVTDLEGRKP